MSYLAPTKRRLPKELKKPPTEPEKIYLSAGEAIVELNKIAKEASESIKFEQNLRAYWYSLAEELGEELRLAAIENNELRVELRTLDNMKKEVTELREKLSRLKQKSRLEQEEEIQLRRQKRRG